jgi:glutaredoxin
VDPDATLHKALNLHAGPELTVPDWISDGTLRFLLNTLPGGAPDDAKSLRPVGDAWLRYLAMCAGIGAPGTLREILRGYFGDYNSPERFPSDEVVKAGFIEIGPGVGPVKMGPLRYSQWFADETGYQRPVELATVRLRAMVEVLTKWDKYVSDPTTIAQRGGTYLFDEEGNTLYEYKHRGVLTYSETMPRPLSFLAPYIGENFARNPLTLPDTGGGSNRRGRGILKPAGKAMGLFKPIFSAENKLQAQLLGAEDVDMAASKKKIEDLIAEKNIVVFTYRYSPFSSEALAVLDEAGSDYKKVEVGLEWFLLDREASTMRAALLAMTGQSSLPHVFINGDHIGGLFTGVDGKVGLAGLKESGELEKMIS